MLEEIIPMILLIFLPDLVAIAVTDLPVLLMGGVVRELPVSVGETA